MRNNEIRDLFIDYFVKNDHLSLPSSAIVPDNDPSLLFTSAGMVPFKDIFVDLEPPTEPPRAVTAQKCLRAGGKHNDLENVGFTARHHTFFEMLGNFSFGDYFKERAIELAWNLVTREFGLAKDRLLVTVYHDDEEAIGHWRNIAGLDDSRIIRIATQDNFWQMGDTGPCGPCSEIFFDHGDRYEGGPPGTPEEDGPRFVEIWNLVFMQFEQFEDGSRVPLPKPSIDTGMGLERIGAVLQGTHDNYATDTLRTLAEAVGNLLSSDPDGSLAASHKVIVDHLRACSFMIADGVLPSNEGRGYVLRRILRRALRHAHLLGAREPMMHKLLPTLIDEMGGHFGELKRAETLISETLKRESVRFIEMLDRGLKLLDTETGQLASGDQLDGTVAFKLYDTFGFPLDLTADILRSRAINVDHDGFDAAMAAQKTRARAAWSGSGSQDTAVLRKAIPEDCPDTEFLGYTMSECQANVHGLIVDDRSVAQVEAPADCLVLTNQTPFYAESGGQQGDRGTLFGENLTAEVNDTRKLGGFWLHDVTVREGVLKTEMPVTLSVDTRRRQGLCVHHSATHLLHASLRQVLGDHVTQKGSLVSRDGLRFDFSHADPLTDHECERIESLMNDEVRANTPVSTRIVSPEQAIAEGAMALFGEKYGDEVRMVQLGTIHADTPFSLELCGGTHVGRTGEIGLLRLTSQRGIAAGVRRIEAVAAEAALEHDRAHERRLSAIAELLKVPSAQIEQRLEKLLAERSALQKRAGHGRSDTIRKSQHGDITLYRDLQQDSPAKLLKGFADRWKKDGHSGVYVVVSTEGGKASLVVALSDDLTDRLSAVDLVRLGATELGGSGGGGRADLAQAGGSATDGLRITAAFDAIGNALNPSPT